LRKIVIISIFLFTHFIWGQENSVKIELPELLVGMFNDYNGRQFIPDSPEKSKLVTRFYCSQKKLSELFVDSLKTLNKELNFEIEVKNKGFIEIYSTEFSAFFNRYYKYTLDKDFGYEDENEIEYDIYRGRLNKNLFKSKNQKLSFLVGTFLRHGTFLNGNEIRLDFANSPNHFRIAKKFLRRLNLKITETSVCNEITIPCAQRITFELNNKYGLIFKELEQIRPTDDYTNCE
jgi:hypothetical protein